MFTNGRSEKKIMISKSTMRIQVSVPNEVDEFLTVVSMKDGISKGHFVREALYRILKQDYGFEVVADNPTGRGARTDIKEGGMVKARFASPLFEKLFADCPNSSSFKTMVEYARSIGLDLRDKEAYSRFRQNEVDAKRARE